MSPLPTRASWVAGAALLALSLAVAGAVGLWLDVRSWPVYAGLLPAVLLLLGGMERLWQLRALPRPPRARGKLKMLPGGKDREPLAEDDSHPRWLM
jgi:protein-S-isoprenylcysteine O-methyltransferase Ste14